MCTPRLRSRSMLSCTAACSHISVCMAGANDDGSPGGEQHVGEQVVADAAGVETEDASRGGSDENEVGGLAQVGVWDRMGIVPERCPGSLGPQRIEGGATYEAQGAVGEDRDDMCPGVDESTADLDRLVGGDATGHPQDDASPVQHLVDPLRPTPRTTRRRAVSLASSASGSILTPTILSAAISSKAMDSGLRAEDVTCGGTTVPSPSTSWL